MARIAGVDIPDNKRLVISLTYIFGIGSPTAEKIVKDTGIDPQKRVKDLSDEELGSVRKIVGEMKVEGDLKKEVMTNIKRLNEISAYRGVRHRMNLPVRGQRTHTNARTRKGPKRGQVGMKKKVKK